MRTTGRARIGEAVAKVASLWGIQDLERTATEIYARVETYEDLFEERDSEDLRGALKAVNLRDIWEYLRGLTRCLSTPSPTVEVGDEFWIDLFLGGSSTTVRTSMDGSRILGGEIVITPFGYHAVKKYVSRSALVDILGYEGGDYFFAASIHEKLGILPGFLDQESFRYSLCVRRAVQYALEEKVIDEFTDEVGIATVANRIMWLERHFRKVFPPSRDEFLLSTAIYQNELRGRSERELKKVFSTLIFPLSKDEIPKEYKTLMGIEVEFL